MTDAAALAADLRDRALVFVDLLQEAGAVAAELAAIEAQRRAALNAAGQRDPRPDARELAAEVVTGYLSPLHPYLTPLTTRESARRAAEELSGEYSPPLLDGQAQEDEDDGEYSPSTTAEALQAARQHSATWPFK